MKPPVRIRAFAVCSVAAAVGMVAATACAGPDDVGFRLEIQDSAGVRIVHNAATGSHERWSAVDVVSIGELDGPAEYTFNRIADVVVGPMGRVFVLDGGDNVMKAYDAGGAFLFQVGGEGEGPSEFSGASLLIRRADTVAVFDFRGPKLAMFNGEGDFLGTARSGLTVFEYGFPARWDPVPGGAIVVLSTGCSMPRPEDLRPQWKVLTLDAEASVADTVTIRPRQDGVAVYGERFCTSPPRLGGPKQSLAVRSDGTAAFGDGSVYEIALFTLEAERPGGYDGNFPTPQTLVRREVDPAPLSSAEIEAHRERWITTPEGDPIDRDRLSAFRAAWDSLPRPAHYPYYDELVWDDEDRLWVGRVPAGGAELRTWDVYSETGELVAEVELPEGLDVHAIDDGTVWGTVRDDLGVMYVRGFEIRLP